MSNNYKAVKAALETGYGSQFRMAEAALEKMQRDVERLDWLLAHQPWHSVVTRERLDVWMKLEGGDAPRSQTQDTRRSGIRSDAPADHTGDPCKICYPSQQDAAGASDEYAYETATDAEHAVGIAAAKQLVPSVNAPECAVRKALSTLWARAIGKVEEQCLKEARAALSTPCPCEELLVENERLKSLLNALGESFGSTVELLFYAPLREAGVTIHQLRADLATEKAAHLQIIEALATALMPDSPKESAMAEFYIDAMGACQIIRRMREDLATEKAAREVLIEDNARLRKDMDVLNSAREKAEAALAEAVDIIQGYMDGPQSWSELNRRLDRAATFVAAHRESKDAA